MSLDSGTRLGVYEISAPIGKGGMGEVYHARDTKLGREVAIKILPQEFTERAEYWSNAEVLSQATSQAAEIVRMAGKLNRHGKFGEIREGWVADLLLHFLAEQRAGGQSA